MNINKGSIDNLVRNNKKISDILSKINEMKEDELKSILDEISKLKLEKKVENKKEKGKQKS
jgi:phosphopantothenate synthetase